MPDQSTVVIAVLNSKGGVGKTTTAVNLAAALAAPRRRVLLVDLDSQACASHWLGVRRHSLRPSVASCLLEKYPVLKAVRSTATAHLDVLPGSLELANVDLALCNVRGREFALRRMLDGVRGHYDLIVADGPPGMSLLAVNAITASDGIIVPVLPEPLAVEGLGGTIAAIEKVRSRMHSAGRLLGLVITMLDPRRKQMREIAEGVRAEYRDAVFHTEIRWSAGLSHGPVAVQAGQSGPADAFRRLAGEVLQRLQPARR